MCPNPENVWHEKFKLLNTCGFASFQWLKTNSSINYLYLGKPGKLGKLAKKYVVKPKVRVQNLLPQFEPQLPSVHVRFSQGPDVFLWNQELQRSSVSNLVQLTEMHLLLTRFSRQ